MDPETYVLFHKPPGFPFYFITGSLPKEVEATLEQSLSYQKKGADYAQAALVEKHAKENIQREKDGLPAIQYEPWDGKVHFLKWTKNHKKLYFPIGLRQRAEDVLSVYGIGVSVSNEFSSEETKISFSWNGPVLRDYQKQAAFEAIRSKGGIIVLPTGAGKSLIGMKLVQVFGCETLILVHKHEILKQWCESIEKVFGLKKDMLGEGIARFPGITVATVQTLYSGLKGKNTDALSIIESQHDLVIADEIHHYSASTFYLVGSKIDARIKIGLTATPNRDDGEDMKFEAVVGNIIFKKSPEDLISDGYLAKPVFEFIEVPYGGSGKTYAQIYSSGIVHNEARNMIICDRVKQLTEEGRQVYVHVERIVHGQILSAMMKAPFVSGSSKDRDETIDTFKKGYTNVLISTLLSEGVDIPSVSGIVLASGGKSEVAVIQRIGRALRPDPKFKTSKIIDLADRGRFLSEHAVSRFNTYVQVYGDKIVTGGRT